ncbi:hypothetical protein QFC19_002896 [Naganishia cerealis]|uniref:Uncharacterized protein n=1 Tax=Naganishia cerealis TaxID=610337 RepID=A0ACC2W8U9_9TREE|nr:hypothetical protein QFC19_002896 [Naganishia cerealis]
MSTKVAPTRKVVTSSTKTNTLAKNGKNSREVEEEEDEFGGYGSEEASAETRKKTKATSAKQASVSSTSVKKAESTKDIKKPSRDDTAVTMDVAEEDEPPRKRTSSRLQGKTRAPDALPPIPSATTSVKTSAKSAKSLLRETVGKETHEEEADLGSRVIELEQELLQIQAQLDRRTSERDSYVKQVKELKDKKSSDADKLYEKYKATADSRATAQDQVIETLQELNDRLNSRVSSLEKDLKLAKTVKPVEKEVKKQPEVDEDLVKKLKARLQAVEEQSKQKDVQIKDYETEVKLAKDAIASANKKLVTAQSASSITRDAEETAKDADIIKWYEDLTNLVVLSVKVVQGDCGREVDYTPIGLEAEKDQAFLSRLDMLKDPFTFTRDQAYAFMANLQEKMTSGEDTEE